MESSFLHQRGCNALKVLVDAKVQQVIQVEALSLLHEQCQVTLTRLQHLLAQNV
ncbi:hypothetical protein D3C76_1836690 [compost metagenome]